MLRTRVGLDQHTRKIASTLMRGRKLNRTTDSSIGQLGRTSHVAITRGIRASASTHRDLPRVNSLINDNYCVNLLPERLLTRTSASPRKTINCLSLNVKHLAVKHVHSAPRHSQKRELSPGSAGCYQSKSKLKYVEGASSVIQLYCVQPETNVMNVASNLPVGARLQNFWQTWLDLGESNSNSKTRVHPSLSDPAKAHKISHSRKLLWQSPQEQLPVGGITSANGQKCSRACPQPNISGVFQPTFSGSQNQQQMETDLRSEQTKPLSQGGEIQNGNTGNHQDLPPIRGVGHLDRFQGRLLSYPHTGTIQEISQVPCRRSDISVQSSALWPVHSSLGVHSGSQRGQTDGYTQGYKNPPVPRRLVGEGQIPPSLSPAYTGTSADLPKLRVASESGEIRTGTQTGFQLRRLPVRPPGRSGPTHYGQVAKSSGQDTSPLIPTFMSGQGFHVLDRIANSHRKTSSSRSSSHETNSVAFKKQLESTRVTRKENSGAPVLASTLAVVARRRERSHRPTTTPNAACSANIYRRIKRRLGRSFKRAHCKRRLVATGKQIAHKLPRTQGSIPGLKRVPNSLFRQNSTDSHRQHYSSVIHQQGRRLEVGNSMRPSLENSDLVHQESGHLKSQTYPWPVECSSRQAFQARTDHPDRVVPPSSSVQNTMHQKAPTSDRSLCDQIQQQGPPVCVTGSGLHGHCSRCTQSIMGGAGRLCLPTDSHIGQSGGEAAGHLVHENHYHCSRVAQHALVLGPGSHVQPDPPEPSTSTQLVDTTLQPDPSQKSVESKSPCLAPRASAIKEQGFSKDVATRIEAPQRGSTRSVYEAKWSIFTKWCLSNKVDFRAPPVKSIADFLLYLFQDRNLQPSTIDGYRSAIADKLGNSTINISKDENLTRLLDSFHRDRPKGRRGIPSWNLSLVLHQLIKPPL